MSRYRLPALLLALLPLLLGGCSSMLPTTKTVVHSPWATYRDAQLIFDKIIPGQTTNLELRDLQLDPEANPNIAILNYSDVLQRFVPHASISMNDLSVGRSPREVLRTVQALRSGGLCGADWQKGQEFVG